MLGNNKKEQRHNFKDQ